MSVCCKNVSDIMLDKSYHFLHFENKVLHCIFILKKHTRVIRFKNHLNVRPQTEKLLQNMTVF